MLVYQDDRRKLERDETSGRGILEVQCRELFLLRPRALDWLAEKLASAQDSDEIDAAIAKVLILEREGIDLLDSSI